MHFLDWNVRKSENYFSKNLMFIFQIKLYMGIGNPLVLNEKDDIYKKLFEKEENQ